MLPNSITQFFYLLEYCEGTNIFHFTFMVIINTLISLSIWLRIDLYIFIKGVATLLGYPVPPTLVKKQ